MHPAAAVAYDLATTPRNPADLAAACRAGWSEHRYKLTYSQFSALLAVASRIGGPPESGMANAVAFPYPPDEVLALVGSRHRGAQASDALAHFLSRVAYASTTDTPLAPGPSLEEIDREFKNHAVFICAYWLGSGLMTMAVEGGDQEGLLREVRDFLEGLGS